MTRIRADEMLSLKAKKGKRLTQRRKDAKEKGAKDFDKPHLEDNCR